MFILSFPRVPLGRYHFTLLYMIISLFTQQQVLILHLCTYNLLVFFAATFFILLHFEWYTAGITSAVTDMSVFRSCQKYFNICCLTMFDRRLACHSCVAVV